MDHTTSSAPWLWLATLTTFALFALASDRTLLAAGMLLLGMFAFFNDPLSPTLPRAARPSAAVAASWACGAMGVAAVVTAGMLAWL